MPKFGIFYIANDFNHSSQDHTPFAMGDKTVYIRGEVVEAEDDVAALDLAEPRDGESVMNSHGLED